MPKKIRLIDVDVIGHFVLDDGKTITRLPDQAATIPADEWETYSSVRFPHEVEEWEQRLNTPEPKPNREQRRAREKDGRVGG